jgi:hypothetical protein
MKIQPAGLRFAIGAVFISVFYLAWGLAVTHFSFVLLASTYTMHLTIKNGRRTPGGSCGLIMESNGCTVVVESPLIGGFVEGQHEIKSPTWSGKTNDGLLASPLDCHKKAKMMSYEGASQTTYHPCFI